VNRGRERVVRVENATKIRYFPSRIDAVYSSFHSIICLEGRKVVGNPTRLL
jgi:hypothetical protein